MARYRFSIIGLLLLFVAIIPIVRNTMEASMVGTMLFQYPLLISSGYFVAKGLSKKFGTNVYYIDQNGIASILMVIFVIAYWCLPRSIDAALNEPLIELLKYASLPVLVGIPLYYSWQILGSLAKSFLWANLISMIFVMSWLYYEAPIRLCNNYLVNAQQQLGKSLFFIGIVLCVYFLLIVFIGKPKKIDKKSLTI